MTREYHVAKYGSDRNNGTQESPFLTISRAAKVADEGDTVIVHEGEYREWVKPEHGARSALGRIVYTAAEGEKAVIKGSEIITGWQKTEDGKWTASVSNEIFGDYNPYSTEVNGDWMIRSLDHPCHTGMVYLDGKAIREINSLKEPKENEMLWDAKVLDDITVFTVFFADVDPNEHLTEINVRKCCFYPEKTGLNYITVRGFEMSQCATTWAPPTTEQFGIIGPHWAKGWIIENNRIHDARCSAVSIGKEISTGDNEAVRYRRKPGYQTQLEVVFAAKRIGWSKETIGSHIIRNNVIYDCGQNGIVGHLGSAFSEIYGNEIYNIGSKSEYFGYEIAGIKLHAAIDTQIHHNNIHHCSLGSWFDWQAQGIHLYGNVYHHNFKDFWFEVTHGPHIVSNNIFGAKYCFLNAAQGGAYVHNLFCGGTYRYDVIERSTPYHFAHSTDIKGCALVYGGDDRLYNNIFVNTMIEPSTQYFPGTAFYNGYPDSLEEYIELVKKHGKGDVEYFMREKQPVYLANNYYGDGVPAYEKEKNAVCAELASEVNFIEEADGLYLEITLDEGFDGMQNPVVTTDMLGMPRLVEARFENPDGTPITIDTDMLGVKREGNPTAGPLQTLKAGKNRIKVWSR